MVAKEINASYVAFSAVYLILFALFILKVIQKLTLGRDNSNVCLTGKTAIITGGNTGIGFQTALKLASRGCRVIIADIVNTEKSVQQIINHTGNENIEGRHVDLASISSVREFANEIIRKETHLDILINNAGCAGFEGVYTNDGILKWLQVNYLGPFLLTHLLVDLLKKSKNGRIVFVSSYLAYTSRTLLASEINKQTNSFIKEYQVIQDYSISKICVMTAAGTFAKKLKKYGIVCSSLHPGLVATTIFSTSKKNMSVSNLMVEFCIKAIDLILAMYSKTPAEGAETALFCATSPKVESGAFYADCRKNWKPSLARNKKFATELWEESEKLVGLKTFEILN